jgi:hypothetical protein
VVVARHLLLPGAGGVNVVVRGQQTAAEPHVLETDTRAEGDLFGTSQRYVNGWCWDLLTKRVFLKFTSLEIGLEKRAHLGVTRAGFVKNYKVNFESRHKDKEGQDD